MPEPATNSASLPTPAFCQGCGYSLRGLPTPKCPECGRAFNLADHRTFAPRPPHLSLRRWARRISLLTLLLTLAAASVPAWYWWQWHREQAVIAAIRGAGGRVVVERIELGGAARFLPARWAFLHERTVIVDLRGDGTAILDRLDLSTLAHLHRLGLSNCGVADPVLARLRGMTQLEFLDLDGNPRLDGTGLPNFAGCRTLVLLDLHGTGVTDAGLAEVRHLTSLLFLDIAKTPVSDAGIGHLASLTSLTQLDLSGTGITDAGLAPLRGLTCLRDIWLKDTKVTEQGRRDLKKALPNLRIID